MVGPLAQYGPLSVAHSRAALEPPMGANGTADVLARVLFRDE